MSYFNVLSIWIFPVHMKANFSAKILLHSMTFKKKITTTKQNENAVWQMNL